MRERSTILLQMIDSQKERLREGVSLYPFPVLISVILCLLLTGHLLLGLNQRLGSPSQLIELDAKEENEGAIWLSVSLDEDNVVVTTASREVFTWGQASQKMSEITAFLDYLKQTTENVILTATLAKKISKTQTTVVIAVDHGVKFQHMKMLLSALAVAGISDYAFEVKSIVSDISLDSRKNHHVVTK